MTKIRLRVIPSQVRSFFQHIDRYSSRLEDLKRPVYIVFGDTVSGELIL